MVNLEHKLTIDDLIVEYMMYKVKNDYEPSFLISEFMNFLLYFEEHMSIYDSLYDGKMLFKRFFERKNEHDWSRIKDFSTMQRIVVPHIDMEYSSTDNDYLIKANYRLSDFDRSIINTYFMDNGMSRFDNFKGQAFKIRSIIGEYLTNQTKRKIDEFIEINDNDLLIGKYIAAEIITNIWDSHVVEQIKCHRWPTQCRDINKYLFEMDLAEIISVKSIKKELIELYSVFSKRIAILYQQDRNLKISSCNGSYLARSNYRLLINGYEKIIGIAFGEYKKSLDIDLSTLTFKESHEIVGVYVWDEESDVKTTTTTIGNDNVKKLIKNIDKNIQ